MSRTDERHVATLFNEMADEYDHLRDEWYPHLFREIDRVLVDHLSARRGRAVDVGCGTGFQTFRLRCLGLDTAGLDIAEALVRQARAKAPAGQHGLHWLVASALALPFADQTFAVANCSGSTLSFIPDYQTALGEIARVLADGGCVVVEVEQRWNLDLLWGLLDGLIGGRLGFRQSLGETWGNLVRPRRQGIYIRYPFTRLDGSIEHFPLHCFTRYELEQACHQVGLQVCNVYAVHSVTNLLPSTWLGNPHLHSVLRAVARALTRLDRRVRGLWPFKWLGCSVILVLERQQMPACRAIRGESTARQQPDELIDPRWGTKEPKGAR